MVKYNMEKINNKPKKNKINSKLKNRKNSYIKEKMINFESNSKSELVIKKESSKNFMCLLFVFLAIFFNILSYMLY